ncbi:ATP-binding protein [Dysosmobacter acutus]|nr:AAA family ATPase [Dysosmobacter acutus]
MSATFGKLTDQTLELSDGLNLICAPNEAGKSTWCAFLSTMLYGFPARERGPLADKNRFTPWSGAAMRGSIECRCGGRELLVTRDTARASSPLGRFSAVYAGTADEVPGLTASSCGEELLGVPREVFERSALIRQAGMAVGQDAELERRIASLITTGEEDTSYTESCDRLKKQLNRRRYNKNGLIPDTEAVLRVREGELAQLRALTEALQDQLQRLKELDHRCKSLKEKIALCRSWEEAEAQTALRLQQEEAQAAQRRAELLRSRLEEERIPTMEEIARLRAAIVNLGTVRKSVEKAREDRDNAQRALYKAEVAVNNSPFAGQSPESARKTAASVPALRPRAWWFPVLLFLVGAGGTFLLSQGTYPLWAGGMAGCTGLLLGLLAVFRRQRSDLKKRTAFLEMYQASSPEALAEAADTYIKLYMAWERSQEEAAARSAAAEALYASLTTNEQAILIEIRRFRPAAFDLTAADDALRECVGRRREASEAETQAREAALRCQFAQAGLESAPSGQELPPRPQESPEELKRLLEAAQGEMAAVRSQADQLQGRLSAIGDEDTLRASVDTLRAALSGLQQEYDAIAMAMDALSSANTTLQNRFSPELGRRAAQIFSALTGGRYCKIALDRSFGASAQAGEDPIARDVRLLSQGTADQLYLAVRLAICDLLLPPEKEVPLILDDALVTFDDQRMAAALDYLSTCGRQILMFTCQSREADYLRTKGLAHIQSI